MRISDLKLEPYADLRGADLSGALIVLSGILSCPIYITKSTVQIGCKIHPLSTWIKISDKDLEDLYEGASKKREKYKEIIASLQKELI